MDQQQEIAIGSKARKLRQRRQGAGTRELIFRAAMKEFSRFGYSGARMDRIASTAKCNIRMVYHHFGKKKDLYRIVLEEAYVDIRQKEEALQLTKLDPVEGMVRLLEFTFDHFMRHPEFVALLTNENLMHGKFVLKSKKITQTASPLRNAVETLVKRGKEMKLFPADLDAVNMYVTIAALSWFHLSNAYTLSSMFGRDLTEAKFRETRQRHVRDVVKAYLSASS